MKQREIVLRGKIYTREEIESALAEMNKPEPGSVVLVNSMPSKRFLVCSGDLNDIVSGCYGAVPSNATRVTDGTTTWTVPIAWVTVVGSFQDGMTQA